MRKGIFSAIVLGFFALMPLAQPAAAQPRAGVQPLDRLLPGIRRAHPGDFYDAEGPTWGPEGNPHYHLKWMTPDGRIVWYDADARNGRVLRTSPGRDQFDAPGYRHNWPDRNQGRNPGREQFAPGYGGGYAGPGYGGEGERGYDAPRGGYGPRAGDFGRRGGGNYGGRGGGNYGGGGFGHGGEGHGGGHGRGR